ncbi:MAG: DUF4232 domain-containing protein [Nocardiaceae bacterium]|nr:DUF4232 domain-containing protein [Nocardiaceae bacterium]
MKAGYFAVGGCTLLLAVAGCGNSTTGSETASPTSAVRSSTSAAATTTTENAPAACTVGDLAVKVVSQGGAAGSTILNLTFTNTSDNTCTLDGFPGVSYANDNEGQPIGQPATRDGDSNGPISLAPGYVASSMIKAVNVQNYSPEDCGPTSVAGLRVYPPNSFDSAFVSYPTTGCSNDKAHQLGVTAVSTSQ